MISRLDRDPLVLGLLEVTQDGFDRAGMGLIGFMSKAADLADGKRDVGPSVGAQIEEHAADPAIVPWFIHVGSILVRAEGGLGGWHRVGVAVLHSSSLECFLDESTLGTLDQSVFQLVELDPEELFKSFFLC